MQFHNPALPIQVTRVEVANASEHAKVPAILKVTYGKLRSKKSESIESLY